MQTLSAPAAHGKLRMENGETPTWLRFHWTGEPSLCVCAKAKMKKMVVALAGKSVAQK